MGREMETGGWEKGVIKGLLIGDGIGFVLWGCGFRIWGMEFRTETLGFWTDCVLNIGLAIRHLEFIRFSDVWVEGYALD